MSGEKRDRAQELAQRRELLVARCDVERRRLRTVAMEIETQLSSIDAAVMKVRRFTSKPAIISTAIAAFVLIGPQRSWKWVTQAVMAYGTIKRAASVVNAFRRGGIDLRQLVGPQN